MSLVSTVVDPILNLHGPPAYALVGALVFSEAALFVGFVLPGETAALLGGVLAHRQQVALAGIAAVAVAAAILGDSVGYEVGRHSAPGCWAPGSSPGVSRAWRAPSRRCAPQADGRCSWAGSLRSCAP